MCGWWVTFGDICVCSWRFSERRLCNHFRKRMIIL